MRFTPVCALFLLLTTSIHAAPLSTEPSGEAVRDGMAPGRWSSGIKQIFGTAYESYGRRADQTPRSRVWFTGGEGILNEVYWPTIDTPQTRDSQFVVTGDAGYFFEERQDSKSQVEWLTPGVPAYRIVNRERDGKFTIEKTVFTDPGSDVLIQRVRITRNVTGLKFHILHNPSAGDTPMGNSARASLGAAPGAGLFAWQGTQAQALVLSVPLRRATAAFEGAHGAFEDIRDHHSLQLSYETATRGNVALAAELDLPDSVGVSEFDLVLGFGADVDQAYGLARATLAKDLSAVLAAYTRQWSDYQASVADLGGVSRDGGKLYRASVAVLKSMEDKTHGGAFVASPTIPWGNHQEDRNVEALSTRSKLTGGYHLVWPRDLYQMATTFLAIHDPATAVRCLDFLKSAQYGPESGEWVFGGRRHSKDGSFPQNMWVNGEPYWAGLQMDEAAVPVVLAYRLWKAGQIQAADYWDMVRRAADLIQQFGPWSPQERWEEAFGISPSNVAAEITALRAASALAGAASDWDRARLYRETADAWSAKPGDNLETWLFTTTGALGDGHYFTRIQGAASYDEIWNPNSETVLSLANGAGHWREKDVTDAGFLELVRFGVRPALDPAVVASLPEIDQTIRVDVPGIGPGFRRYIHDRYNYDNSSGAQTDGMLWPLLTGERAHYELQRALEQGLEIAEVDDTVSPYIRTIEKMATPTLMIPEQVWDGGPQAGQATGSATPLGWSHAEYVKLLRSRQDRAVFDRLSW